jgi:hypothetical protein
VFHPGSGDRAGLIGSFLKKIIAYILSAVQSALDIDTHHITDKT